MAAAAQLSLTQVTPPAGRPGSTRWGFPGPPRHRSGALARWLPSGRTVGVRVRSADAIPSRSGSGSGEPRPPRPRPGSPGSRLLPARLPPGRRPRRGSRAALLPVPTALTLGKFSSGLDGRQVSSGGAHARQRPRVVQGSTSAGQGSLSFAQLRPAGARIAEFPSVPSSQLGFQKSHPAQALDPLAPLPPEQVNFCSDPLADFPTREGAVSDRCLRGHGANLLQVGRLFPPWCWKPPGR